MPAAGNDELEAAVNAVRRLVHSCALDIVQGRVTPDEGAAALARVRGDLADLEKALEGFIGLEDEYEMAGYYTATRNRPEALAEIQREILKRAERLRRTLER